MKKCETVNEVFDFLVTGSSGDCIMTVKPNGEIRFHLENISPDECALEVIRIIHEATKVVSENDTN